MIVCQEERKGGGQEDRRKIGHADMRTGEQVVRRTKGHEDKTGGTIHWKTHIPLDVHVLRPHKCLKHHKQRLYNIFWACVNLLLTSVSSVGG